MPSSVHSIFKNSLEFLKDSQIGEVPYGVRGIYVLYLANGNERNVVYVGMARGEKMGVRSRLISHKRDSGKIGKWDFFSVFEVWDNITPQQVEDLEGMFRHIFRLHNGFNGLAKQLVHKPLARIKRKSGENWKYRD